MGGSSLTGHEGRIATRSAGNVSLRPEHVVADLEGAAHRCGQVLSAHLWLHDTATRSFRQLTWAGAVRTLSSPVAETDEPFARAVADRRMVVSECQATCSPQSPVAWRYAIPVDADRHSGAATIDFSGPRPDADQIASLAEAFLPRLVAGLALHIAETEASAAAALMHALRDLTDIADATTVAETLLGHAVTLSGAHTCSVMLAAEDGSGLRIAAAKGLSADIVASTHVRDSDGVAGWVWTTRRSVVVEDPPRDDARAPHRAVKSAISVPIISGDDASGVLNVGYRTYPGRSMESLRTALESLAELAGRELIDTRSTAMTQKLFFESLRALVLALETKDPFAHGATARIVDLTTAVGAALDMAPAEAQALRIAALLHDIGMHAAGDAVSISSRPLSTMEHALVKMHPVVAADILRQAPALERVVPIVYHHHEHYDGRGYIAGVAGEQIPLGSRVLSAVDAYVAMTSDRPYRRARTPQSAIAELQANAGTQFDPVVVDALERILARKQERPPQWAAVEDEL